MTRSTILSLIHYFIIFVFKKNLSIPVAELCSILPSKPPIFEPAFHEKFYFFALNNYSNILVFLKEKKNNANFSY